MAGRIALDLKQFKHLKSDDKSTTLQHADGHQLTLALKALSKEAQEQLKALSPIKEEKTSDDKKEKTPETVAEEVKKYAEGTPDGVIEDPNMQAPTETPAIDPALARKRELYNQMIAGNPVMPELTRFGDKSRIFGAKGEEPQVFDTHNWAEAEKTYSTEQADNAAKTAAEQQKAIQTNQARTAAGLQPIPVPNVPQGPQIPEAGPATTMTPQPALSTATSAQPTPAIGGTPTAIMQSGYADTLKGINDAAAATGALGKEQEQALKNQVLAQQTAQTAYKQSYDALEMERKAHMNDIHNAHIDPNKYWTGDKNGNGSHSKIAAGIGMILAGFNPTSKPNAAIDFLNKQMEMNLQAQKENLGSEQNLLSANIRQFGNLKDATEMTRLMQSDIVHNQLLQAAAKAQTPMAKAAALQAAGQLKMAYAPLAEKLAGQLAFSNLSAASQQDPSKIPAMLTLLDKTDPKKAEDMRSRWIPGVGFASTKEDRAYLEQVQERRGMIKSNVDKAVKMIKEKGTYEALGAHNATLNGLIDQIATDMAKLQDPNSVARPGEVELVKKNLTEAGLGTANKTATKQLENFMKSVDDRANRAFTIKGIKPPGITQSTNSTTKFNFKPIGK